MVNICNYIIKEYKKTVEERHSKLLQHWPVISGYDAVFGKYSGYYIFIFKDTGNLSRNSTSFEKFNRKKMGVHIISDGNIDTVREFLIEKYNLSERDYAVLLREDKQNLASEIEKMLEFHELGLGIKRRKIFLSYHGKDLTVALDYKITLEMLGFEPWLNEDVLEDAGVFENFLKGLNDSCAAVFLISKDSIKDDEFKKEAECAAAQKRLREDFSILTLAVCGEKEGCKVPRILRAYLSKQIGDNTKNIMEIIKTIPLQVCNYSYYRN